jgi:hypothetical protein
MESKTFLILSFVIIVAVSAITSWIAISTQNPVLLSDDQGEIIIPLGGGTANVVIIDDTDTEYLNNEIMDTVTFNNVLRNAYYSTDVDELTDTIPYPFLVRNDGGVIADVEVGYMPGEELFVSANSIAEFWFEEGYPDMNADFSSDWSTLDYCEMAVPMACMDGCYGGGNCEGYMNKCAFEQGVTTPGAITSLQSIDECDIAFLHIGIQAANDEPDGTKQALIQVVGSAA